ncbi:MAG: GIY-YIG nuclease family protein [Candidatus Pacebacteria bacterium]|nr:GIY-YIG nuclease family protein [Candidatus Paceibacterota bacterium]
MWFVYILSCEDGSFYAGTKNDLERRFKEHRDKKGGRYTKIHKVDENLYFENFSTQREALSRERQIKGWTHKEKENLINFGKPKISAV